MTATSIHRRVEKPGRSRTGKIEWVVTLRGGTTGALVEFRRFPGDHNEAEARAFAKANGLEEQ